MVVFNRKKFLHSSKEKFANLFAINLSVTQQVHGTMKYHWLNFSCIFLFRVHRLSHAQRASFINMQLYRLWYRTFIVVVIVTTVTCQIVPKLHASRRSISKSNVNIEDAMQRSTTKQNTSNFADGFQSQRDVVEDSDQVKGESTSRADDLQKPHSRKKRLIWITDDGRLALPPGTVLSITPTLSLPLVRYPLEGFLSNMTMSFPLTIDFDKLGLTDNENPLGVLPPVFARSMGRAAGSYLGKQCGLNLISYD